MHTTILVDTGSNLSAHQHMIGSKNYGTFTQWNSMQQKKGGAPALCDSMKLQF